ncbi:MAG: sigma-70 family RNA polymerase sigma factor [Verrucomicrobiaceae bacterium]|nr:MAG: sigma-70 family RNA polymerase sigma factor [Verrucomicrobiaceae bacterium]
MAKYMGLVRGVALRRSGNPQLADDVAQTVFILTARKAGALNASPTLAPWLHHCAWCGTSSALRAVNPPAAAIWMPALPKLTPFRPQSLRNPLCLRSCLVWMRRCRLSAGRTGGLS